MLDFGPFFKGFRPHSTLKNPIFFRALRARVFLERFPLSIAPKPDFFARFARIWPKNQGSYF